MIRFSSPRTNTGRDLKSPASRFAGLCGFVLSVSFTVAVEPPGFANSIDPSMR